MDINGKICVITGALGGIGLSIVKKLLNNGIKFVALFDLDNPSTRNVYNTLKKEYGEKVGCYPCDVANKAQFTENFDKVIAAHKVVDIFINNAGIGREVDPELIIDINYKAVVAGTLMMINKMGKHKGGKGGVVVNTASIVGLVNTGMPLYCSTKHAVVSFTRNMDIQFDVTGIRVMAVCPGVTKTPILDNIANAANCGLDFIKSYEQAVAKFPPQAPDNVGDAFVQVIETGKSGEVWVSEENQAPYLTNVEVKDHKDLRV